jgi:hypothetical protein
MLKLRVNLHDVLFGIFLIVAAGAAMFVTRHLTIGTAANMGPGYMPLAVALIILGFGVFLVGRGLLAGHEQGIDTVQLRPILAILISVGAFALLAERAGLVAASFASILIAGFGGREFRIVESILFACVLTACAALLFVRVLDLPLPLWPW